MQASVPGGRPAQIALGSAGLCAAVLAVADKLFGFVQRPLQLATLAYALLGVVLVIGFLRARVRTTHPKLFVVAAALGALLTAIYVYACRVSADPTPVVLHAELERGDRLLDQDDLDGAHLVYLEASRRYPHAFAPLWRLGALNYRLSDYERARRYFERAAAAAPDRHRWRALNDLGQTEWQLGNARRAVELYHQAEAAGIPPESRHEWHYRLGWAYFDVGDYDLAIQHYQSVAREGRKYVAASWYNSACARARKLEQTTDPAARRLLVSAAVQDLRRAYQESETMEEKRALRGGLLGSAEERDPDLRPLYGSEELRALVRELTSGAGREP